VIVKDKRAKKYRSNDPRIQLERELAERAHRKKYKEFTMEMTQRNHINEDDEEEKEEGDEEEKE